MASYRIKRFAVSASTVNKVAADMKRVTVPTSPVSMKTGQPIKLNVNLKNKVSPVGNTKEEVSKIINQNYKQLQTPINFEGLS